MNRALATNSLATGIFTANTFDANWRCFDGEMDAPAWAAVKHTKSRLVLSRKPPATGGHGQISGFNVTTPHAPELVRGLSNAGGSGE